MKLVRKHAEVGYITPQLRPGCGNCRHIQFGDENGLGVVLYKSCRKHGFEVRAGGVCGDHKPERAPRVGGDVRTLGLFA